jgi:hypothetical protein
MPIEPGHKMYYPLVTAISVLYSRPFKRSKGIESLTLQFLPKKFLDLHRQLILVRDQMSAHVDARSPLSSELPANNVRLFMRGNKVAVGVTRTSFDRTAILRIHELAGALVQRMLDYIRKVASRYPNELPNGDYIIDLTTKSLRRCD